MAQDLSLEMLDQAVVPPEERREVMVELRGLPREEPSIY